MLSRLRNMFRVADLRNKILFTLLVIAMYRLGSHLAGPVHRLQRPSRHLKDRAASGGALGFLDLFSGGALTSVAVFALGIMPYITSSIIMQLLAVVIPKLEEWQQEGPGRPEEDHPVDPLPDRGPGAHAVDRHRVRPPPGRRRLPRRPGTAAGHRPDPALQRRPGSL